MDQFEIDIEADRRIKAIKEQRSFGPLNAQRPLCPICGTNFLVIHTFDDGEYFPEMCVSCYLRRFNSRRNRTDAEAPPYGRKHCNRCWEERPLVGAWCVPCRDKFQWAYILELIRTDRRTPEQNVFLTNVAPYWATWRDHEAELREMGFWIEPMPVPMKSAANG